MAGDEVPGRGEPQVEPAERAVRESGAHFTILRAAFFAQNFSEGFLADGVHAGEIAFPAGQLAEPFIDADDVAEVAVGAIPLAPRPTTLATHPTWTERVGVDTRLDRLLTMQVSRLTIGS